MRWLASGVALLALGCAVGGGEMTDAGPPPPMDAGGGDDAEVDSGVMPGDCFDGTQNGDETDRDCGGSCPVCMNGQGCAVGGDCRSMACVADVCADPTCDDGFRNGDESDVDCGGVDCDACPNGSACFGDEDCSAGTCDAGTCTGPTCDDVVQNADETDVDCGGDTCPPCAPTEGCLLARDCDSGVCGADMRCRAPACDDGLLNGAETDVDCGGGTCPGCGGMEMCLSDTDCASAMCTSGTCEGPACESFPYPDGTTVPGWTEVTGDFLISSNRLYTTASSGGYANHITLDGSTMGDGCATLDANYGTGSADIRSIGIVLRWTSPTRYIVAVIQDNTRAGLFNSMWIYEFRPGSTQVAGMGTGPSLGTNPRMRASVTGTTVLLEVDVDRDGTYDQMLSGTTTITAPGLVGAMGLSFGAPAYIEELCPGCP